MSETKEVVLILRPDQRRALRELLKDEQKYKYSIKLSKDLAFIKVKRTETNEQ